MAFYVKGKVEIKEQTSMKFICEGTVLSEAAFTVSKACAAKPINPIMECIKLKAENDGVTLTAYVSFKEIADATGVSINTALGRMRYAVLNMRRIAAEKNVSLVME